jgi:hypothetical protein
VVWQIAPTFMNFWNADSATTPESPDPKKAMRSALISAAAARS